MSAMEALLPIHDYGDKTLAKGFSYASNYYGCETRKAQKIKRKGKNLKFCCSRSRLSCIIQGKFRRSKTFEDIHHTVMKPLLHQDVTNKTMVFSRLESSTVVSVAHSSSDLENVESLNFWESLIEADITSTSSLESSSLPPPSTGLKNHFRGSNLWGRSSSEVKLIAPKFREDTVEDENNSKPSQLDFPLKADDLVASLKGIFKEEELHEFLEKWKGKVPLKLMIKVLDQEMDWQRALALHDWMIEKGSYEPSIYAYNVVLKRILKAREWSLAEGLANEMQRKGVSPDNFTCSTFISNYARAGKFQEALKWFRKMEEENIPADIVIYSNLIDLAKRTRHYDEVVSLYSKLTAMKICPDLILFDKLMDVFCEAKLFTEARKLLDDAKEHGNPSSANYTRLLVAYARNEKYKEALSIFSEMKSMGYSVNRIICNAMIKVYGKLNMVEEAELLFNGTNKEGILRNAGTFIAMLKVYEEAHMFGDAFQLFQMMQRTQAEMNSATYNTMIKVCCRTFDHEKAAQLFQQMLEKGIEPNYVTYSTLISMYGNTGKYAKAEAVFQKLQSSQVKIDDALYYCMILVYERASMVGHVNRLVSLLQNSRDYSHETAIAVLARSGKLEEAMWLFNRALAVGQVNDVSILEMMMDVFLKSKKYFNVIQVYDTMRQVGFFPGPNSILNIIKAYEGLRDFQQAESFYKEVQTQNFSLPIEVHFHMLNHYASKDDMGALVTLFEKLEIDDSVIKKELYSTLAQIYENLGRYEDAVRFATRTEPEV